uniref:b(0,+)-type amino acid transporter 1 n=2 Tax=Timema TaxID=61471 RepID=A0A7R9FX96_TIMSH|nr:unnamed protein product [Timema shepardi]
MSGTFIVWLAGDEEVGAQIPPQFIEGNLLLYYLHDAVELNTTNALFNYATEAVDEDICLEECCHGLCFVRSSYGLFKKTEKKETVVVRKTPAKNSSQYLRWWRKKQTVSFHPARHRGYSPIFTEREFLTLRKVFRSTFTQRCPQAGEGLNAPPSNMESGKNQEGVHLKRELGLFSAVNLIIGVMIGEQHSVCLAQTSNTAHFAQTSNTAHLAQAGSGIFVSPASALERSGSAGLCLIVWAVCGVISLLGALAFAELGTVVPRSGAEYAYFVEAYGDLHPYWGPLPSFTCVWVYVMILRPAEVAVIILTFSEYVCQPFYPYMTHVPPETMDHLKKLIALLALGLMTYINFMSVKLFVRVQNVFTGCKLLACVIVILGGIYELCIGNVNNLSQGFEGSSTSAKDIALAFYSGLWAYDGWSACTVVTEELKRPERNIPLSILIAVPVVTGLYFMMNVAYMTVLTIPEMIAAPAVAVLFGDKVLGPMSFVIPLGVALSTFGCALSVQFGVTRLLYVAGREGHMLEMFSFIHMRRLTPAPAVAMQGVLTLLFIVAGNITALIDFASFLVWFFYGLAMVALIVMRKTKRNIHRPYQVPLWIPILIILVAIFLSVVPIVTDPNPGYFLAIVFILIGVAFYTPLVYYKKRPKLMSYFWRLLEDMLCSGGGLQFEETCFQEIVEFVVSRVVYSVTRFVQILLEVVPEDHEE